MTESGTSELSVVKTIDKLEEVVSFGKENNLVCETSVSQLRNDFVSEAVAQGCDQDEVKALANRINFFTSVPDKYKENRYGILGGLVKKGKNEDDSVDIVIIKTPLR